MVINKKGPLLPEALYKFRVDEGARTLDPQNHNLML